MRAGVAGRVHRIDRGGRRAFVRHADDQPTVRRIQGELEGLRSDDGCRTGRQPAGSDRIPQDLDRGEGGVLARAATSDDDRRSAARRLTDRAGEAPGGALRIGEALDDPLGDERFGGDHVGHVPRRARPRQGLRHLRPRIGGRVERGAWVEGRHLPRIRPRARPTARFRHPGAAAAYFRNSRLLAIPSHSSAILLMEPGAVQVMISCLSPPMTRCWISCTGCPPAGIE